MDTGLMLLRVVTGLLIAAHGVQKVSPWLGGRGLDAGTEEFRRDGFRGGTVTAVLAGATQIGSGLLLAAGLVTPLAVAGAVGVMTVAVSVKWPHGLWVQNDGYEYPLVLVIAAAALAFTGPGEWALDEVAGLTPWPAWSALAAVTLGLGSGLLARLVLSSGRPGREDHGSRSWRHR
ncbi:putative oxidoreductase [Micromonospora echinaurantiaca]|uniref:Putative oxidoreductase n=1 Tax=Micromonospora echinaurantiaca TaxID=47857 RepID=A0A1C5IFE7_9ACTN|nr:DoxX family protein [Micromonospora echinaurantiaca]SCG56895.1 putative oxidoreductase [Micromonospora echinaurantiaca]